MIPLLKTLRLLRCHPGHDNDGAGGCRCQEWNAALWHWLRKGKLPNFTGKRCTGLLKLYYLNVTLT